MDYEDQIRSLLAQRWVKLDPQLGGVPEQPGVYVISHPGKSLNGKNILARQIYYVGMTVCKGGLKRRLNLFLKSAKGGVGHSGGRRHHKSAPKLLSAQHHSFHVAYKACPAQVNKAERSAKDLRMMGHVACLEYFLLALVKEQCGAEPPLNRK